VIPPPTSQCRTYVTSTANYPWSIEPGRNYGLTLPVFLTEELDYAGALQEVIPLTRQLYADSPHREPYSDLDFEFRNFNRALDHWESPIKRLTASDGATQSLLDDPLEELAVQGTFKDRVAKLYNSGPRS
jgi:hypothetical protein